MHEYINSWLALTSPQPNQIKREKNAYASRIKSKFCSKCCLCSDQTKAHERRKQICNEEMWIPLQITTPLAFSTRVAFYYQHSIALLSQCSFDFDVKHEQCTANAFPVHSCIETQCNCFVLPNRHILQQLQCIVNRAQRALCLLSVYRALWNLFV